MEQLEGLKIDGLDFTPKKQGDLLYHEGPLLSHFTNEETLSEHYFYKWADADELYHRWLIFKISEQHLKAFFEKELNLLQLIQFNPLAFLLDLDDKISQKQLMVCSTETIPQDYLPSERSYFDENQYEEYAMVLKKASKKTHLPYE